MRNKIKEESQLELSDDTCKEICHREWVNEIKKYNLTAEYYVICNFSTTWQPKLFFIPKHLSINIQMHIDSNLFSYTLNTSIIDLIQFANETHVFTEIVQKIDTSVSTVIGYITKNKPCTKTSNTTIYNKIMTLSNHLHSIEYGNNEPDGSFCHIIKNQQQNLKEYITTLTEINDIPVKIVDYLIISDTFYNFDSNKNTYTLRFFCKNIKNANGIHIIYDKLSTHPHIISINLSDINTYGYMTVDNFQTYIQFNNKVVDFNGFKLSFN